MQISLPTGFEKLTRSEQIDYIGNLWDWFISQPDETIPLPQWHLETVRERMADPDRQELKPWNEVKQRLWSKYSGE